MATRRKNLEDKILSTIYEYNLIEPKDTVLVAVSGGPDSMCLLNSLYNLREKLKIDKLAVAHVNHMLREEAKEETKYVENFCKNKNIEVFTKYVNIKEISVKNKISEELAGREERYKFFDEVADKISANKIAIAHNYNDNAETVLMHLLRGTGVSGLAGITPNREGKYIRPIIKCNRQEIENYCEEEKLKPKHDKTNDENIYVRNKIRNQLIPYIKKEFNPNIIETLNRLSEIIYNEDMYMKKVSEEAYNLLCSEETEDRIVLRLKDFIKYDDAIKSRIILNVINKLYGTTKGIEKIHIQDIIKLCDNNVGNKYLTPNKGLKVFVKSGKVSFGKVLK